jgi:DNA-directed RNA polymerase specialized sigma24 family protein
VDTVASMLGKSAGVVRVLSHRGLKRLAELVTESGVTR